MQDSRSVTKIRYEIDLGAFASEVTYTRAIRAISAEDLDALANLMLDAYIGTIDYDGEGYEDAVGEVGDYLSDRPLLDHSYTTEIGGELASAVLVSLIDDQPFIGYVMTRAEHKNKGLARMLTTRALTSLAASGHDRVVFYITEGNLASEALFRSLGAAPVPEPD